ncbi:hypothetical protein [Polycladomyces subterraneus]|uniref:EXPERA domain-containing protein n=1 Tax=Polycladomyces subterraneus TaxID=1016997 RepID=A0ABT8IQD7_9BACL|nr:hypothetical protein [Polycladomyces subterraneus]MDN4595005.1 hypothetical protein [Polycladomyces subterraneus]
MKRIWMGKLLVSAVMTVVTLIVLKMIDWMVHSFQPPDPDVLVIPFDPFFYLMYVALVMFLFALPISLVSDWLTQRAGKYRWLWSLLIHTGAAALLWFWLGWRFRQSVQWVVTLPTLLELLVKSVFSLPTLLALIYWILDEWWKRSSTKK